MFKKRVLVTILCCLLVFLIGQLFNVENNDSKLITKLIFVSDDRASSKFDKLDVVEVDDNDRQIVDKNEDNISSVGDTNTGDNNSNINLADFKAVVAKKSNRFDGMTVDELANKLERSLKNELSGKGYLYASYSLEKGVDPYLAVAISLEETGCNWNCSRLVKTCNNVGGMKGKGCGSYGAFPTLDDGIKAFIDNIYRNYVAYGLTTADTMNPKYAENPKWSTNVNRYITKIKNS